MSYTQEQLVAAHRGVEYCKAQLIQALERGDREAYSVACDNLDWVESLVENLEETSKREGESNG